MSTRLVVSIVQSDDAEALMAALRKAGHASTKVGSVGGFLREGNVTLLVGTEAEQVPAVLEIIRRHGHARMRYSEALRATRSLGGPPLVHPIPDEYAPPRPESQAPPGFGEGDPRGVPVGGAVVFVLDVERVVRF
jgi:uncharacterized protein YaaQ